MNIRIGVRGWFWAEIENLAKIRDSNHRISIGNGDIISKDIIATDIYINILRMFSNHLTTCLFK